MNYNKEAKSLTFWKGSEVIQDKYKSQRKARLDSYRSKATRANYDWEERSQEKLLGRGVGHSSWGSWTQASRRPHSCAQIASAIGSAWTTKWRASANFASTASLQWTRAPLG